MVTDSNGAANKRESTAIDAIAEDWVATIAQLQPTVASYIGVHEHDHRFADYSPAGAAAELDAAKKTQQALAAASPVDAIDEITKSDLLRELTLAQELHSANWQLRDLNVIASPVQDIRAVFDLMPSESESDWETISNRLLAIPEALSGYRESLELGTALGVVPAKRQVTEVAKQARQYASSGGFFNSLNDRGQQLPDSLNKQLGKSAAIAAAAYAELADYLTAELLPAASESDAVGRELYALHSRRFLGATVDLDESYEWGREELARMVAEQKQIAAEILPGASIPELVSYLENNPEYKLCGTEALQKWMQETSDAAVQALDEVYFDIPEQIKTIECMIAPTQDGGIYYTAPSDDFSRPGRMWWSVPEGVNEFDTWRELTTVYHEGVPGHHLQIAQAVANRDQLNSWRRLLAGTSGHAEGWALYAERLMSEFGFLDAPADRFGMLDGQRMRAARVVLDIGVHLGKTLPPEAGGDGISRWNGDNALEFMRANVNMADEFVRFEVNRYLGWPGQAPSYKLGQRIFEQLREEAAAAEPFSLRDFHKRVLNVGSVGLDTLRFALS